MPTVRAAGVISGGATIGTGNRSCTDFTPVVGDYLIVTCALAGNSNTSATCSDNNGGTYVQVGNALFDSSGSILLCFVRTTLFTNTTLTTVTVSSGSNTAGLISLIPVTGMSRTGASSIRGFAKFENKTTSDTPAVDLPASALTANVTFAVLAEMDITTRSAPTSWTEQVEFSIDTPNIGLQTCTRDSGFTGTTITWPANFQSNGAAVVFELDGSNTATVAKTLSDATASGTGTVDVAGTASPTLGDATTSASAAVHVAGTLSKTLDATTLSGTGQVQVHGTLSKTLGDATTSAVGAHLFPLTLAVTLGDVTLTARNGHEGLVNVTLGDLGGAKTGVVNLVGTSSITLQNLVPVLTGSCRSLYTFPARLPAEVNRDLGEYDLGTG